MVWDAAQQTCLIDPAYVAGIAAGAAQGACGPGTVWSPTVGACVPWVACPTPAWNPDSNADGAITIIDLLAFLSVFEDVDSDGDGIFDGQDDCVGIYDACGVCGGAGVDADADGVCDDEDTCVGALDACGVCNGPGPNIPVIDQIIFATDSVYIPALGGYEIYQYAVDTTYTYTCPEVQGCSPPESGTYDLSNPLATFYLSFTGPSSYNAGSQPEGAFMLRVSGTFCYGSCWNGHTTDAAFAFNSPWGPISPYSAFTINEYCPENNALCETRRPIPDEYNPNHVYTYYYYHSGGELVIYGLADCCWGDNSGGLSFELFPCIN